MAEFRLHPGLQAAAQAWCSAYDAGMPAGNPERAALCAAFREVLRGANPSRVFAAERRGRADGKHPRAFIGLRLWHELDTWCERAEYDEQPDPYLDRVVRAVLRQLLAGETLDTVFSFVGPGGGRSVGTTNYPAEVTANRVLEHMYATGCQKTPAIDFVNEQWPGSNARDRYDQLHDHAIELLGEKAVERAIAAKSLRFVRIDPSDPWDSVPAPAARKSDKPE